MLSKRVGFCVKIPSRFRESAKHPRGLLFAALCLTTISNLGRSYVLRVIQQRSTLWVQTALICSNDCCLFAVSLTQPTRRRHWYDVVTSVAHQSKQLLVKRKNNDDDRRCSQAKTVSPCAVSVFCCSTTQPIYEGSAQTTSEVIKTLSSTDGSSRSAKRKSGQDCQYDVTTSQSQAVSDFTRLRDLFGGSKYICFFQCMLCKVWT